MSDMTLDENPEFIVASAKFEILTAASTRPWS